MLETWEERAYREQQEYDPQDYCGRCNKYFGRNNLEEWEDMLVCRFCYEELLEEEENE